MTSSMNEQLTGEKPTMLDLWHRHKALQNESLFEIAEAGPVHVIQLFAWNQGTQATIDAVLRAVNQLAGTDYTPDDIRELIVLPFGC